MIKKLQLLFAFALFSFAAQAQFGNVTFIGGPSGPLGTGTYNFIFKYEHFAFPAPYVGGVTWGAPALNLTGGANATMGAPVFASNLISIPVTVASPPGGGTIQVVIPAGTFATTIGTYPDGNAPNPAQSGAVPLPIELAKFDGTKTADAVELSWTTLTETNNARFVVERSFDGKNFASVGALAGAGTTASKSEYRMTDATALSATTSSTAYYRLVSFDTDGTEFPSAVISVKLRAGKNIDINYVNVAQSYIGFEATEAGEVNVTVTNTNGQIVSNQTMEIAKGFNQANIDAASLTSGVYVVVIRNGNEIATKKFVK